MAIQSSDKHLTTHSLKRKGVLLLTSRQGDATPIAAAHTMCGRGHKDSDCALPRRERLQLIRGIFRLVFWGHAGETLPTYKVYVRRDDAGRETREDEPEILALP